MIRQAASRSLALALLLGAAVCTGACRERATAAAGDAASAAGTTPYDIETTDIARVLGGMPPSQPQPFAVLLATTTWRDYEAESRSRWTAAKASKWDPVRRWAGTELKETTTGCQTLLHPFGGTDFLPAYLMFPLCEGYVLVGGDPVGQMPTFTEATALQVARMADEIKRSFPEVFAPGAAPTRRAASQVRPGALRLLLVQLARLDARIVHASRFDLASNGHPLEAIPIRGGNARPAALSLTFEVPGLRPQSLVYLPADLDDGAMKRKPGVWTFLRLQAPFTTLLAPAADMSGEGATILRDLILDQSRGILQDRPAIPARLLGPGRWTVSTLSSPPAGAFGPGAAPTLAVRRASASPGPK